MKKTLLFLSLAALTFISCNNSDDVSLYQEGDKEYVEMVNRVASNYSDEVYKYPIIPGTNEWAELQGYDDMQLACMIPASWAVNASTKSLILTFITNPIVYQTHYYDYQLLQYTKILTEGAGMAADRVLQTRNNVADAWLNIYDKMSWQSDSYAYSHLYDFASMRHLLLNLNLADQKRMAKAIVERNDAGKKATPIVTLGNLMICAQYKPFETFLNEHPEYIDAFELGFGRIPTADEVYAFTQSFVAE